MTMPAGVQKDDSGDRIPDYGRMMRMKKSENRMLWVLILHGALLLYACTSLFSKNASRYPFMSLPFLGFYAGMIAVLGIYAVLWQQVIKHLPVTLAYANKGVTVVWGVIFGVLFFGEKVSPLQIAACGIIILGTVLYVLADSKEKEQEITAKQETCALRQDDGSVGQGGAK